MEKYTFLITVVIFDYISLIQAGLIIDSSFDLNLSLNPLKELNPLSHTNKAIDASEEALIDHRNRNHEDDRDFWQNAQSKSDHRYSAYSDIEITTQEANQRFDHLKELNPLYQMKKAKSAVEEALIDNRPKNQQDARGFWQTSQTRPAFQGLYNTETTTAVDENVAQLFPQAVDLLNKLQELNKLKEEGKLQIGNKPITSTNRPDDTNKKEEVNILKPPKVNELKVLKPLTKKKFYYQVRPVIPENERRDVNETIYYIDL